MPLQVLARLVQQPSRSKECAEGSSARENSRDRITSYTVFIGPAGLHRIVGVRSGQHPTSGVNLKLKQWALCE